MVTASSTPVSPTDVTRWTRLHIALHWLVVVLIAAQFFDGEWMAELFDASTDGTAVSGTATVFGYLHMATGIAVFLAISTRLWDRRAHGRPPHPPGEPNWAQTLAKITQTLLYATVLAMPVAGLIAWLTGNHELADLHGLAAEALLVLVALHVAGALANHFWFKTDVLRRMLPGHGR